MNIRKNISGFTLLEIMVTIIIVGAFTAVALMNYSGLLERQKAEEGKHILHILFRAQKAYAIDNGNYTNDLNRLDVTVAPNLKYFAGPIVAATNPIASIRRNSVPDYTLRIDDQAAITCQDNTPGACAGAGFP